VADDDRSGFARLIQRMSSAALMDGHLQKPFVHPVSTDGQELVYRVYIGRKLTDIPDQWLCD